MAVLLPALVVVVIISGVVAVTPAGPVVRTTRPRPARTLALLAVCAVGIAAAITAGAVAVFVGFIVITHL